MNRALGGEAFLVNCGLTTDNRRQNTQATRWRRPKGKGRMS